MLGRAPIDASQLGAHLGDPHKVNAVHHVGGRGRLILPDDDPDEPKIASRCRGKK
jgi:hypothetical protein